MYPFLLVGAGGALGAMSRYGISVLIERGAPLQAGAYVLLSVVLCLIGLYLGLLVTRGVA